MCEGGRCTGPPRLAQRGRHLHPMPNTSVVERAPDGKFKDARFGFPESQKAINRPARQPDFFYLPAAAVVRMALWVVDVRRSIAAGVAVLAMAYRFWRAL
jgi:hypothetical protein